VCSVDRSFDDGDYATIRLLRSPSTLSKGTAKEDAEDELPDIEELLFPPDRKMWIDLTKDPDPDDKARARGGYCAEFVRTPQVLTCQVAARLRCRGYSKQV